MKGLLIAAFLCGLGLTSARAGVIVNVSIDESANGTTDHGSPGSPYAIPGGLAADPSPSAGLPGNVLVYLLPFAVVNGDLVMTEPGASVTVITSDLVRFVTNLNNPLTTYMVFYSDNGDGVDALADTGLPTGSPFTNIVTMAEVGAEGANGVTYVPTAGQPGYFSSDFTATYNIVSDAATAPEPATFALIGAGLVGLGLARRFRSN